MKKVYIIAEAGVNHNGSLELAKRLIVEAKNAGVDAVKFQTFKADLLVNKTAQKAEYQKNVTNAKETQYEMIKKLELDELAHIELISYCKEVGIEFLSTAFDIESIKLLHKLGIKTWKIPSGEITNLPFLRTIGKLRQHVILSTGMANLGEVEEAIFVLEEAGTPRNNVIVLHCTTEYPAPFNEVNLSALETLAKSFKVKVGYSDHTQGIEISIAAVAMGAVLIEKHFTLDKTMDGPDHMASLEPKELALMVSSIRNVELSMGNGIKVTTPVEEKNKLIVRKSIVASCSIKLGDVLTGYNITTKRPGNGINPMRWDSIIGTVAKKNYNTDDLIE